MKKRLLSLITAIGIVFSLMPVFELPAFAWSGDGKEANPYLIENAADLQALATAVNGGTSYSDEYFRLTTDIDLSSVCSEVIGNWTPIGTFSKPFAGTFDGSGHTISGLYFNDPEVSNAGLFGCSTGTIKNLGVSGSVTGGIGIGSVCGWNYGGTIENCRNDGTVTGRNVVGGVCGDNSGTIKNCCSTGTVSGSDNVGGVCGNNKSGTIENCYNTGTVTGNESVGGVCGNNKSGTIISCYNTGTVSGSYYVGGVCGNDDGTITSCYYLTGTAAGGISSADAAGQAEVKTTEEFRVLTTSGGFNNSAVWEISPILQRPVLISNREGGTGKEADPYIIPDYERLCMLAAEVNKGNTFENKTFRLTKDIVANENVLKSDGTLNGDGSGFTTWTPIGEYVNGNTKEFKGTFDGSGHTISGLYLNDSEVSDVGLFGLIGKGGTVKNVGVINSYFNGKDNVGGVCGYNGGTIISCCNAGTVSSSIRVGGVCGNSSGTITSCCNTGSVKGGYDSYVGGVCGYNSGIITSCYNTGSVTCNSYVGGVCGYNSGIITSCCNTGTLTGGSYIGGVCAQNYSTITSCRNTGTVIGDGSVGGVCGNNNRGTMTSCCNTGTLTGGSYIGGVCGNNNRGTITNCCNTGTVEGRHRYGGGVCGENTGTITSCYNTGTVRDIGHIGGVCGSNASENYTGIITNCYYLTGCATDGGMVQNGIGSTNPSTPTEDTAGSTTVKTADEFKSGEVAKLLQDAQTEVDVVKPLVWGQTICGDSADKSPVLMSFLTGAEKAAKTVYKVTFATKDNANYAVVYVNPNGIGTDRMPNNPTDTDTNYVFAKWATAPEADAFTATTQITDDITLNAYKQEKYGEAEAEKVIETTYGTSVTQDLSAYVGYAGTTASASKFDYAINGEYNNEYFSISGDMLTVAGTTPAGTYSLSITAAEKTPQITTFALNNEGTKPVSFTVTVAVNKADPVVVNNVLKKITKEDTKDGSEATAVLSQINMNGNPIRNIIWTYTAADKSEYKAEYTQEISGESTVYFGIVVPALLEAQENQTTDEITVNID